MNTQENNKLIAEFMELRKVPCKIATEDGHFTEGYKHPKLDVPIVTSGMQYKYSWDWLMPVVDSINNILDDDDEFIYSVNIHPSKVTIYFYQRDVFVSNEHGRTTKEMLYLAVVEFIKQHNESTD